MNTDINQTSEPIAQQQAPVQQPAPQQVVEPQPVAVVQPAPVVQPQVTQSVQDLAQQIVQPQVAQAQAQPSFELPQGVTDRTRDQFDKLTDSNRRLLEANRILQTEITRRAHSETQVAPITQTVQTQQPDVTQFVETDPLTGEQYVNEKKLQEAITQANSRAQTAVQQIQQYIETQQRREDEKMAADTFTAYPQLNPNDLGKYDTEFNRMTRMYVLDSMMSPEEYGSRTLTFKEAADLAYKKISGTQQVAAPSVAAQQAVVQQENMDPNAQPVIQPANTSSVKEQGGLSAEGRPVNVNPQSQDNDLRALQDRTRRGDMWALAQRLQGVSHTGTPTHSDETGGE